MIKIDSIFPEKLALIDQAPDLSFVSSRRVLVFCFTPQWISYLAPISIAMAKRGCQVDIAWSPIFEHDNADVVESFAKSYEVTRPTLDSIRHPAVRAINIQEVPLATLDDDLLAEVEAQSREDVVHFTREVKANRDARYERLYRRRLHVNQECMSSLLTIVREGSYDQLLVPDGKVFEFGVAYRLARHLGLPVCSLESFESSREDFISLSWDHPAILWNQQTVAKGWEAVSPRAMMESTVERVHQVQRRFDLPHNPLSAQFSSSGRSSALWRELDLDPDVPVVLVLPSLGFEKQFRYRHTVFDDCVDWFDETVAYLADRDDCQVVIRAHPYPYGDRESDPLNHGATKDNPESLIRERFSTLPRHFRFIAADADISTYDLLEIGDVLLTYHSLTGLEFALLGKPSVVVSTTHYTGKGFTHDPTSTADYFGTIDALLTAGGERRLEPRQVELAWRYTEFFYFEFPSLFPWNICIGGFLYDRWPIERVLSLEGSVSRYMETFDLLISEEPLDGATRLREVVAYVDEALACRDRGDLVRASRLLGRIEAIDLDWLGQRHPSIKEYLLGRWELLESIKSQASVTLLDGAATELRLGLFAEPLGREEPASLWPNVDQPGRDERFGWALNNLQVFDEMLRNASVPTDLVQQAIGLKNETIRALGLKLLCHRGNAFGAVQTVYQFARNLKALDLPEQALDVFRAMIALLSPQGDGAVIQRTDLYCLAGCHFHVGTLQMKRGDLDGARRNFAQCLLLLPQHGEAARLLSRCRQEAGPEVTGVARVSADLRRGVG